MILKNSLEALIEEINMKKWEKFERNAFEYIRNTYGDDNNVGFEYKGSHDSTAPDIDVTPLTLAPFNVEIKSASAQCGQFVVLDCDGKFIFSKDNESKENIAKPILEHMNEYYEKYKSPGKRGIEVEVSTETSVNWILAYYKAKNTRFFLTKYKNKYVLLPIEKFKDYFSVKCKYRVKRSGSKNVPKKYAVHVANAFRTKYHYEGKYFVIEDSGLELGSTVSLGEDTLKVSRKAGNGYVITILGKTENPNVIFQIKSQKAQDPKDVELFIEALK